ncbi:MAG TPA: hypothetical protein VFO50_00720 [Candidatus Limnocylindrales bacterium]|nr:hypothetical protein [Candidatus Limnocylindrales bacterium]
MTSPATLPATPEPTHACVRCGRPVAIDVALCETCNPLGLRQPAATQVHAIAAGGIVLFVAILAVLARVGLADVGPFEGNVANVEARDGALVVTIAITNEGTKGAATTCRVVEERRPVGGPGQVVQTPTIPGGETVTFSATVTVFGPGLRPLAVDCQSP